MKFTGKNPLDPNDRSNWTRDDGSPLSDDQWTKFQQWHQAGANQQAPAAAGGDTPTGDTPWYTQLGRGAARGVASDIPGLSTSKFATQDDAGPIETGARWAGEYGPLFIPGLDLGLGAKAGLKAASFLDSGPVLSALEKALGPDRALKAFYKILDTAPKAGTALAKGAIGGVAGDPEHPVQGAATGALTGGAVSAIPSGVKKFATGAAATGTGLAAYEAMRGHGESWPAYFAARHTLSPLVGLASAAALQKPALAGAAGSAARRWWEGDDDGQQGQ
jgi:hypothetical protein